MAADAFQFGFMTFTALAPGTVDLTTVTAASGCVSGANAVVAAHSSVTINVSSGFLLGDVNLDGAVNLADVSPFVDILSNMGFQDEADINQDGEVNLLDVAPFVDLLTG